MEETQSVQEQEIASPAVESTETFEQIQQRNWAEVRNALAEEKAARKRQEVENAELKAMLAQAFHKPSQEEDEELDIYSEDFGKKLERKLEKVVEKTYEKIEQKRKRDPSYLEEQARKKYADFDTVMTPDNVDNIIKANPLVYDAIMRSSHPVESAYEFIKSSASFVLKNNRGQTSQVRRALEEKNRLAENANTPVSPNAIPRSQAISAVSGFRRLTEAQAREIHADTMKIKRGG